MPISRKALLTLAALALPLFAFVACGSDLPAAPEVPADFDASGCYEATMNLTYLFERVAGDENVGVRSLHYFSSPNTEGRIFLAADIEGPGYEGAGPIEVWWAQDPFNSHVNVLRHGLGGESLWVIQTLTPVNETARKFSKGYKSEGHFRGELGPVPDGVEGAEMAELCAAHALAENPAALTAGQFFAPGRWFGPEDSPGLIVEVEGDRPDCLYIPLSIKDGDTAYSNSGWPRILNDYPFRTSLEYCEERLLLGTHPPQPVIIESIPERYRSLMNVDIPLIPTPAVTPTPIGWPTPRPAASPYPTKPMECVDPPSEIKEMIFSKIKDPEIGFRAFQLTIEGAVPFSILAADLEGPGFEGAGPLVLFDISDARGKDIVEVARQTITVADNLGATYTEVDSSWIDFSPTFAQAYAETYAEEIEFVSACVRQTLVDDPDTPVYKRGS
jgi:hypothetical protein